VHIKVKSSCMLSSSSSATASTPQPCRPTTLQTLTNARTAQHKTAAFPIHNVWACAQERKGGLSFPGGAYEGQEQLQIFKRKYVYSPTQQIVKPLDAMPAHLARQILSALDDLRIINSASAASCLSLLLKHELRGRPINTAGASSCLSLLPRQEMTGHTPLQGLGVARQWTIQHKDELTHVMS